LSDSSGILAQTARRADVMVALRQAADATGADFSYLLKTAQRESNLNPEAKAPTSSATGLFQFTDATWLRMVDRYGAQHGLSAEAGAVTVADGKPSVEGMNRADILELRKDPVVAARMAGELARENAGILAKKIGREASSAELYAAHFMGPSDAARLISAARRNDTGAASEIFPRAALANENVFRGKDGGQLTAAQLYQKLTGDSVQDADAGKVAPAVLEMRKAPDPEILVAARLGAAQLASSLMTALFEVQSEDGPKRT
jgi:hypothetical protein